jgi:hypothetical protein
MAATPSAETNPAAVDVLRRYQQQAEGSSSSSSSSSPGGSGGRKKTRLPAEYRSLLAGEAGLDSDSDDEVDHLVATLRYQRVRAGRWKLCAFFFVALVLGTAVGGMAAISLMDDDDDDDDDGVSGGGGLGMFDVPLSPTTTRHCAEASSPQHRQRAEHCQDIVGGYCVDDRDTCPGTQLHKIRGSCSPSCGCCFDPDHCPEIWKDDGECDGARLPCSALVRGARPRRGLGMQSGFPSVVSRAPRPAALLRNWPCRWLQQRRK